MTTRPTRMLAVTVAASALAALAALPSCALPGPKSPEARPPVTAGETLRKEGPMRDVHATEMAPALAALGLDPENLPPIESLDKAKKLRVMRTFTKTLGVVCVDCHVAEDFAADTPRKRVAKRMWNDLTRVVAMEGGEPVYCDSCHQGALFPLDRRDKAKVAAFMSDVFVDKMKRSDGRDHGCETCHGDPPDYAFLAAWRASPAPDVAIVAAPAPAAPSLPPPMRGPTPPVAVKNAKRARAAAPVACGDKDHPCPLQKWMRKNVAAAVAANDSAALAKALDRVATLAPDPSWTSWVELSKIAADAARRGDMSEARKSCRSCHHAYNAKWVASYRTRAIR